VPVIRAAIKAWYVVERRHQLALETATEAEREMDELARIIEGDLGERAVA
jgi:hypothetical protein